MYPQSFIVSNFSRLVVSRQFKYQDSQHQLAVVINNGPGRYNTITAGEEAPVASFPVIIGWPKQNGITGASRTKKERIVEADMACCGGLVINYLLTKGIVVSWDDMKKN